jgi:serine/threonine protein kinase
MAATPAAAPRQADSAASVSAQDDERRAVAATLRLGDGLAAFHVERELGRGSFGRALLVSHLADRRTYVVKQVDLSALTEKQRRAAMGEVEILSKIRHANVIEYYGCWHESATLNIVL